MSHAHFLARRQRLLKIIGDGVAIVPTAPEFIDAETTDSLVAKWFAQTEQLQAIGIDRQKVFAQTLITPSCGTGAVSRVQAEKVLELTGEVSAKIRASFA